MLNAEAIEAVLWHGDANNASLIVSTRERKAHPLRLWRVSVVPGRLRAITNDASDYLLAGLSDDRQRVIAVRVETSWSMWVASLANPSAARRVDAGPGHPTAGSSTPSPVRETWICGRSILILAFATS